MGTIDIKLKSYEELQFEITRLNTDKYLLEQKLNKQKEVLDKIKEYIEYNACCLHDEEILNHILKLLEEIE